MNIWFIGLNFLVFWKYALNFVVPYEVCKNIVLSILVIQINTSIEGPNTVHESDSKDIGE